MKFNGLRILSVDAKDLYNASHFLNDTSNIGYNIRNKDGEINEKKFYNTLDNSLDLPKLREVYFKKYRNNKFSFSYRGYEYTKQIVNVTFLFSDKDYNIAHHNCYVKAKYNYRNLEFEDSVCVKNGELLGINVGIPVENPVDKEILSPYFAYDENNCCYCIAKQPKVIHTRTELREKLYTEGFVLDGVHYVRFKRTAGSARVGKCLFINEELYKSFHKWECCGVKVKKGDPIDLAAFETYKSLSGSSIIDTLYISPKSILVIDDYDSEFFDTSVNVYNEDGMLKAKEERLKIKNSIWDGQSLLDESLFKKYPDRSMLLLRERMAKTAGFRCDIQRWFKDNNITEVSQLNGITFAKDISEIKMITTPNSIKYSKFGSVEEWLQTIDGNFGIVKHEKKTHYFDGRLVQSHYQLLNTLQLTKTEVEDLLRESFDFIEKIHEYPEVVRYFVKMQKPTDTVKINKMVTKNDIVYNLLSINDKFCKTKYYREFIKELTTSFYSNLKKGHILINGNYSTLLGNPIEMLQSSIGKFNGDSQIGVGNIYNKNFSFDKELLGSRSPHVCFGNVFVTTNKDNKEIEKYFPNLSSEVVVVNSINENLLNRLSGCDYDSDTVMLTDNSILIESAKKNYNNFCVPVNSVQAVKTQRYYTTEQMADLDTKTSDNKIGEIINFAQVLNTLYWSLLWSGSSHSELKDLYFDICILDILSGVEIDKAKKEFDISPSKELKRLKKKYEKHLTDSNGKQILPFFFAHISRKKGYYNPQRKKYVKQKSTMDMLQTVVNSYKLRHSDKTKVEPFSVVLDNDKLRKELINYEQINEILEKIYTYYNKCSTINSYFHTGKIKDYSEKECLIGLLDRDMIEELRKTRIGYSTMYDLLCGLENIGVFSIKTILLKFLFECKIKAFRDCLKVSAREMYYIKQSESDDICDYKIYNIPFVREKFSPNHEEIFPKIYKNQ